MSWNQMNRLPVAVRRKTTPALALQYDEIMQGVEKKHVRTKEESKTLSLRDPRFLAIGDYAYYGLGNGAYLLGEEEARGLFIEMTMAVDPETTSKLMITYIPAEKTWRTLFDIHSSHQKPQSMPYKKKPGAASQLPDRVNDEDFKNLTNEQKEDYYYDTDAQSPAGPIESDKNAANTEGQTTDSESLDNTISKSGDDAAAAEEKDHDAEEGDDAEGEDADEEDHDDSKEAEKPKGRRRKK